MTATDPRHEEPAHAHWHPTHGVLFETVCALSMTLGRGAMARAVAELAGLSRADVVVDVGCGPGTAARRARRTAGEVFGVDPSAPMLRLGRLLTAARRMDRISFVEGAAESMPLETASATVIWAIQSAHHWREPGQGLREARRVLAPGGRLIVAERAVAAGARGHAAHGLTEHQAAAWARLATDAGFEDVGTRPVRVGRRRLVAITASAPPIRS
jgi:ubiquinone/menaquinone biosynthesis C-methylase UbiE